MDFKVKADPKPEIVWYHEGKILKETSRLSWSLQEKESCFYIRLELKVGSVVISSLILINFSCIYKNTYKKKLYKFYLNKSINLYFVRSCYLYNIFLFSIGTWNSRFWYI